MRLRRITRGPFGAIAATMAAILAIAVAGEFLVRGQSISSDEVRWSVRNFVPAAPGTIQVRSELVQADVVVRDGRGNIVSGLAAKDFEIYDNGKQQKVSLFSVETAPAINTAASEPAATPATETPTTAAPKVSAKARFIALLMDDTSMANADLVNSRRAAQRFVRENMLPGDKAGVFTTSTQVTQMFTEDKQALLGALEKVVTRQKRSDYGPGSCPRINVYQAYILSSFEGEHSPELELALAEIARCPTSHCNESTPNGKVSCIQAQARQTLALAERFGGDTFGIVGDVILALSKLDGKRIIVMPSSGFWSQTIAAKREKVIDEALRASVVINTLDAKGLDPDYLLGKPEDGPPIVLALRPDLQELAQQMELRQRDMYNDPMAQLADATGGRFFHNNNDLGRGLREMAAVPEVSYVLGFSPAGIKPDGKFHELKVKVPGHGDYTLTARKGYFASSTSGNIVATAPERRTELEREVMSSDSKQALPVDLATSNARLDDGSYKLQLQLKVGVEKLPFEQREERRAERLILITALFDAQNNFLSGAEGILDLSLKAETWKRLKTSGVNARLTLTAPQGKYRLREVVQEEGKGMISAFSREVEIQ